MDKSVNSISTILPELLRLYNNSLEGFEKITEAITSDQETVAIDVVDNNNNIRRMFVPSFGYLKNKLELLETNFRSLVNVDSGKSSIKLSDGQFRNIMISNIKGEADDVTELNTVSNFNIKDNYFFENFINPYLYISLDLTGKVPRDIERIEVYRFILDLDNAAKRTWFEENYIGRNEVDYVTFLSDLISNGIAYIPDRDIIDVPPRTVRFKGGFNVIRISDTTTEEEINGITVNLKRKVYTLNKLSYTDTRSNFLDTMNLKIGDSLIVAGDIRDTRYIIKSVDTSTNSVVLELIEGYRTIPIGADTLIFYSEQDNFVEGQIGIGFNERCVVFVKPIDPVSKISSKNWSPGVAFYSNDLKITINGLEQSLEQYYRTEVTDFSTYLFNLAKDKLPPAILGIIPDAPVLNGENVSVLKINQHLENNQSVKDLIELQNQKITILSELKELDDAIKAKRELIATKNYSGNQQERQSDKNEERALITERNTKTELYSSIVKEIEALAKSGSLTSFIPKYRARGYFEYPDLKSIPETGFQQIVQFITEHRYLSLDGAANPVNQLDFTDGDVQRRAAFSPWERTESKVRNRVYNPDTDEYEWEIEDVENADQYNINTIDIPIRKGEILEVKVMSVSEAGWPSNGLKSDWSNIIRIQFPDQFTTSNIVTDILSENQIDLSRVRLQEELNSKGIDSHLSDSFTANEKYYPHQAQNIASGFLSPEQTPIDLYNKLIEMTTQLQEYGEILKKVKGTLVVKILDEDGNETKINKNQINKFFAGYYTDIVNTLDVKKGVIVSKTFFLQLENIAATALELISRLPGSYTKRVKRSEADTPDIIPAIYGYYENNDITIEGNPSYVSSDDTYNTKLKYDLVPVVLTNSNNSDNTDEIGVLAPYQAAQVKSQFIYCRFKDLAAEESFYYHNEPTNRGTDVGTPITNGEEAEYSYGRIVPGASVSDDDFIFGAAFNSGVPYRDVEFDPSNPSGIPDETIEVHIDHPFVQSEIIYNSVYEQITGITPTTETVAELAVQLFRHSKFSILQSNTKLGKKQNMYIYDGSADETKRAQMLTAGGNGSDLVFTRTLKTSFEENDQYLLGKYTCGSYMFLATDTHETICVDGKNATSLKSIEFGSHNSLKIPLIFQFRMTDYWGKGSEGLGNIAGVQNGSITNVTYAKRMGFDIYDVAGDTFSFDIEIFAKYKSDNLNLEQLPSRQLQVAIDDVSNTLENLAPTILETRVDLGILS